MEEYTPEKQDEEKSDQFKRWFQDNLRVIVSVVIVVLIAGGIYSYSKRTASPVVSYDQATQTVSQDENTDKTVTVDQKQDTTKQQVSSTATSKETEASFVETAGKGDGLTILARRATANYLEKNQDSSLTKEHKIYIEDYLRKNVGQKGSVRVGTSAEFSKDLLQKAVAKSKTLNERQLNNLKKYSARAISLQ